MSPFYTFFSLYTLLYSSPFLILCVSRVSLVPTVTLSKSLPTATNKLKFSPNLHFHGGGCHLLKKTANRVLSPDHITAASTTPIELLEAWNDEYDGVVISPESLSMSANAFASALRTSLSIWKLEVYIALLKNYNIVFSCINIKTENINTIYVVIYPSMSQRTWELFFLDFCLCLCMHAFFLFFIFLSRSLIYACKTLRTKCIQWHRWTLLS